MQPSAQPETSPRSPPRLAVTDLVVERREAAPTARQILARRILDHVGLVVEPGAIVAITGPSGAGKTTLLHAVAGLLKPDAGTVAWGDVDVTAISEAGRDRWRRDAVGLVFQDFQLLAELDVIQNILLPLRFDRWRTTTQMAERAAMLAARVGLEGRTARAGALSRGEQQRVAIARALMRSPQLLLADEPTASLDPENGQRVVDLLIEGARETGASLLMVSHDEAVLTRATAVHRLEAGMLGAHREMQP